MNLRITLFVILLGIATQLLAIKEVGSVSYYNNRFHGSKTASGELYDKNKLTCAHRKHPFGTLLLITNLHNGKQVIVKVNDRGPYHSRRIIDVSYLAAEKLDLVRRGIAKVKVEVINDTAEIATTSPTSSPDI